MERRAAGLLGHYEFTDGLQAYVEASYIQNEPRANLAPVPAQLSVEVNLDNPVLSPTLQQLFAENYACAPNLACIIFGRRFIEVGDRIFTSKRDYTRIVTGLRGDLGENWSFDGWVTYTKSSNDYWWQNPVSRSRVLQGMLVDPATNECYDPENGCVPLNVFGEGALSAEGAAFVRVPSFFNQLRRTDRLASLFVTGTPLSTWAGALEIALGVEWRDERITFDPDERIFAGDGLGMGVVSPIRGSTSVTELYSEAVIPLASNGILAENLALEIGARYSDYEHAGGSWTYKAGLEWRPVGSLLIRVMSQRSTRAPNAGEMFAEQRTSTWQLGRPDPCSASLDPVGSGVADKCVLQGLPASQVGVFEAIPRYPVNFYDGGNPALKPEKGKTLTAGFVFTSARVSDFSVAIDYFDLDITDTIGGINAVDICFDPKNVANAFCANIVRDGSGNIADVYEYSSNRGLEKTRGIDTQIAWKTDLPDALSINGEPPAADISVYWTHLLSLKWQENPVTEIYECAGLFGWPCNDSNNATANARNRVTTTVNLVTGTLGTRLSWRWIEGTDNAAPLISGIYGYPDPDLAIPSIDDESYLDLGFSWEAGESFLIRLGITNVLDNDPPMMADAVYGGNNTDTGLYDVFGRSYYVNLSAEF